MRSALTATRLRAEHGDRDEFIFAGVVPDGADKTGRDLCDDDAGREAAIKAPGLQPDPSRQARQVDALLAARKQRSQKALAQGYRRSVVEGIPGHFDQARRVNDG